MPQNLPGIKGKGNACRVLARNPEGKRRHVDVNERIILKWI
jgi:hypothetical protein